MSRVKHVLPDGAGVVVEVTCPRCGLEVWWGQRTTCPICGRDFCADCYDVHLQATDIADDMARRGKPFDAAEPIGLFAEG